MSKNVCNVRNNVLVCLLAVVMLPVHFPQSPSGKKTSSSLPAPKPHKSTPPISANQNTKATPKRHWLNAMLFSIMLTMTNYLYFKSSIVVHKSSLFFRG